MDKQEYVLANDGHMVTGWNGNYYYRTSGERAKESWTEIDGKWYYFKATGELLKNGKTPDGYTVDAKGVWLKDIPQEVKKIQKETEKVRTTTVENSTKNNSVEKEPRRDNVTHDANPSSVLEKHSNEENHSSSNPNHAVEEVTRASAVAPETNAGSSSVDKEVSSNADSTTNPISTTTSSVGGDR